MTLKASAWKRSRTKYLLCLCLATATGCAAGIQDMNYCVTNKVRADMSWYSNTSFSERRELGPDYARGFKQGFYDAANGKGCELPAVPPPCYWAPKYQTCEGQQAVQCWYRGYRTGAAVAQGDGISAYNEVPVGPCAPQINTTGCQGCYSPPACATNCGQCSVCVSQAEAMPIDEGMVVPPASTIPSTNAPAAPALPTLPTPTY